MALNTDFNVSPYYDDYDEQKNYHRVLFRPAVPIQARELTQLQTILQTQVERFGDNIYRQGTIIKGCGLSFDFNYTYVKIEDLQVDGQSTLVSDYANGYIQDSANLKSEIVNYVQGLESQDPDLSTLYIKYINTGSGSKKKYANGDVLTVYARDYSIQNITVSAAGTLYNNTDVVVFAGGSGTGASANIVTYANGSIRDVVINDGGSGYLTAPAVSITTSTGSSGSLTALNYIAQVRVANSSFTAPTGTGAAVTVGDGIIYQKGHFVRVEEQTTIASKYTNQPTDVALGFTTTESVVNNSVDSTLLDNAQGYSNYTAPGAHRLKLTPSLVAVSVANAASNNEFLSILEFQNGNITKRRTSTEFNSVSTEFAKRTREESGNYVVKPFNIYTEEKVSNTTHLNLSVSSGIGYVDGFRAELTGTVRVPVRKGTDTATSNNQTISTNYGNYVIVNEVLGNFDFSAGASINLRNTAGTDVTDLFGGSPSTPGTIIGTAKIKSFTYLSGTPGTPSCQYKLYLFDVKMEPGEKFSSVRSLQVSGGIADAVLEEGIAVLKETSYDTLIFNSGASAVSYFSNEQYIYRKVATSSFLSTGVGTVSLTGTGEIFPYTVSSTLNDTQELDFIVVPSTNAHSTTSLSGTVTSSGNVVTGTGTSFIVDLDVGDYVKFSGNTTYFRVSSITNATSMTVNGTTGPVVSSNTLSYAFPKNVPVRLDRGTANISIDSTGNTASIYLGNTINGTTSATVYTNVKATSASPKSKSVTKDVYVKLSTASISADTDGPWCLGIPDVYKLSAVYVGTSNTYSNTSTNYASSFELINGQTDNIYGLSYIRKKPGSRVSLSATSCLLVRVNAFTHGTGYYLSTESYPVDDATTPLPSNKIRTEDIPYYRSPKTNKYFNLRDTIDFRPIVANTANVSATAVAGATVDPSSTETLTGSIYFPAPNQSFGADITHYLRRIDTIVIDSAGSVSVVEGVPSDEPVPPRATDSTMKLGTIEVPPYPSLSPQSASVAQRNEYSTLVKQDQVRGYTMKDIKQIEDRVNRIEYYSLLNTLEKDTTDLIIPSEANNSLSRFKNGFFAESFSSYDISNVNDPEYSIYIDTTTSTARPQINKHKVALVANTSASSNVTFKGEYALLNYTDQVFLEQPIANKTRNPTALAWNFNGSAQLFPKYDDYYDVEKGSVNVTIDLATPIQQLASSINDSVVFKKDAKQITTSTSAYTTVIPPTTSSTGLDSRTITTTTTTTTGSIQPGSTITNVQQVGDFVTDFGMNPYIRSQWVTFVAVGLRPNATHYVFFDKVDITSQCRPAEVSNIENMDPNGLIADPNAKWIGIKGSPLITDDNGTLVGAFYIEANKFFCGERSVIITDTNDIDFADTSISSASISYNAYNFRKDVSSLTISTKTPSTIKAVSNTTVDVAKVIQTRVVPRVSPPFTGCCFIAGTRITMADGSFKNIEEVQIGDVLLGKDGLLNNVIAYVRPLLGDRTLVSINGSNPFMTNDHPVYCKDGMWKSFNPVATKAKYESLRDWNIGKLSVGDIIETPDGSGIIVSSISEHVGDSETQVYNFMLDGNHTYVADNMVVHNKDPISQTFNINQTTGDSGVFVTKVDLYFKTKHPRLGITVELRETENGYPSQNVLAKKAVRAYSINVSNTAALATTVTFDTPVYLTAGSDYCIVIKPDQDNPSYQLWVAETGVADVANTSLISTKNWGSGVLFASSNDTTWTPYQTEDIKFTIYTANFTKSSGVVAFDNAPYEFLSLSNTQGSFIVSEEVAQKSNTYLSGLFTANTTSAVVNTTVSQTTSVAVGDYVFIVYANTSVLKTGTITVGNTTTTTVTGSGTNFAVELDPGDYLRVGGDVREVTAIANSTQLTIDAPLSASVSANVFYGVSNKYQISRVNGANSSSITLKDLPSYVIDGGTTYYGAVQKVVRATVDKINNDDTIVLTNSSASNTTFRMIAGRTLVGEESQATATISSVDNKVVNFTESHVRYGTPPQTSTTLIQKIDGVSATAANTSISDGISNSVKYEGQLKSRSNEITSGSKSLKFYANISKSANLTSVSPFIDTSPASIVILENLINNDSTNETTRYGNSSVRYVSKNVVLADGLDAEDIKVYITAYKPATSNILVYAKVLASDDNTVFEDRDWTLLDQVTEAGQYSDSLNENNFIEYQYGFKYTPPSTALSGVVVSSSNTTLTGYGTTWSTDLAANSIIKVVQSNTLTGYDIAVVDAVANNTSLTLKANTSFTSSTASIEKVTQNGAAFKYNRESNVVTYFDKNKGRHSSYKTFAIKVVLVSSSTKYVPILKDLRALAVSI